MHIIFYFTNSLTVYLIYKKLLPKTRKHCRCLHFHFNCQHFFLTKALGISMKAGSGLYSKYLYGKWYPRRKVMHYSTLNNSKKCIGTIKSTLFRICTGWYNIDLVKLLMCPLEKKKLKMFNYSVEMLRWGKRQIYFSLNVMKNNFLFFCLSPF